MPAEKIIRKIKTTAAATPVSKAPRRAKGRPSEDGTVGRSALISATEELLRNSPPDRLTLADIAKHANVTPALIRYYFKSKEGLMLATAMGQLGALQDRGRAAVSKAGPMKTRLSERLSTMIEQVHSNPRFHQLIMDSIYTGSSRESAQLTREAASSGMAITNSLLAEANAEKLRKIDARYLHVAMIGLTEFFGSADPFLKQLFPDEKNIDRLRDGYVEFLTTLILDGLRKR